LTQQAQDDITLHTDLAHQASGEAQKALEELGAVGSLYRDLASEYVRTISWTSVEDWWSYYDNDFPDGQACYYGEIVTTTDATGNTQEAVIDDTDGSDNEGTSWKVFSYNDYVDFVNKGIVAEQPGLGQSPVAVGAYLCGPGGVFADENLPVVLVKERGSLRMEADDEADTFVGNTDYGSWCVKDASGKYTEIPEAQQPPANAEWCWFQPKGQTTERYYRRGLVNNTYVYYPSSRRCIYCTPRAWDSDDLLVPANRMSEFNGSDRTAVRGPQDVGGGPGTGK
jgi:hypothetical protein